MLLYYRGTASLMCFILIQRTSLLVVYNSNTEEQHRWEWKSRRGSVSIKHRGTTLILFILKTGEQKSCQLGHQILQEQQHWLLHYQIQKNHINLSVISVCVEKCDWYICATFKKRSKHFKFSQQK